jgi:hypothetical protein
MYINTQITHKSRRSDLPDHLIPTTDRRHKKLKVKKGKKLSQSRRENVPKGLCKYYKQVRFERRNNTLKEFNKHNIVWNKAPSNWIVIQSYTSLCHTESFAVQL